MSASAGFDERVAELVGAAVNSGVIASEADLELCYLLAVEVVARREGYLAGQRSVKDASLDVCGGADWRRVGDVIRRMQAALDYRRQMVDPAPRAGDFVGVGVAIRKGQAEGAIVRQHEIGQPRKVVGDDGYFPPKARPTDFESAQTLYSGGNGTGVYDLTDGVSDEQLERSLTEARAEGSQTPRTGDLPGRGAA